MAYVVLACESYCEHGGVCILDIGHAGSHDSSYCQWTDAQAISKKIADALFYQKAPLIAPTAILVEDTLRARLKSRRKA